MSEYALEKAAGVWADSFEGFEDARDRDELARAMWPIRKAAFQAGYAAGVASGDSPSAPKLRARIEELEYKLRVAELATPQKFSGRPASRVEVGDLRMKFLADILHIEKTADIRHEQVEKLEVLARDGIHARAALGVRVDCLEALRREHGERLEKLESLTPAE